MIPFEQQQRISAYVNHITDIVSEFCKKEFNLPQNWKIKRTVSFGTKRRRSWGGINGSNGFISIAAIRHANPGIYREYKSYADDPNIGSVECSTWEERISICVLHEISHAVQITIKNNAPYYVYQGINYSKDSIDAPHGLFFKAIYRTLRNKFHTPGQHILHPSGVVIRPEPTKRTVKTVAPTTHMTTGARVNITDGWYRNFIVNGMFRLVKPYQKHKNKVGGFVTVIHPTDQRIIRVSVYGEHKVTYKP